LAFNEKLNKHLEETHNTKKFNCDIVFIKNMNIKIEYFISGKNQSIINGGKICKLIVGRNLK
jgi:hypothetical protein